MSLQSSLRVKIYPEYDRETMDIKRQQGEVKISHGGTTGDGFRNELTRWCSRDTQ